MLFGSRARLLITICFAAASAISAYSQLTTGSIEGTTRDASGALLPKTTITATNTATGLTRSTVTGDAGNYQFTSLPVGDYTVTAEQKGFKKQARKVHLDIGTAATLDFSLPVGEVSQEIEVTGEAEAIESTRSMVSSVIAEREIQQLPVNGRQFIDFALLAPGVTVGDTTSGSTDVIIEPVTKLSFAGQNIHYNFVAIDGADNMSTASGIQKTTPSQEAVQEFRVINSSYGTEFGRAVGGIVNIITKSGTNSLHGSLYEYFRNDAMDAKSELAAAGGFNKLRQNQFGFTLGGPIVKDKTFFFGNYEGQRHSENPFYNSAVLANIGAINALKQSLGLPAEDLRVTRTINYDDFLIKVDHAFTTRHQLSARYFFNDQRATKLSPLNDGFDLPSGFKDNSFRDQSIVGSLTSTLSNSLVNDLHIQYAHRFFDFPTDTTQPHLEVSNLFTLGVNRGNPDFYEEGRWEVVDNVTKVVGHHVVSFGGDFNHVNTIESFPLFYPFEADFASLGAFLGTDGLGGPHPFVIFYERFNPALNFQEPTFNTAVLQGQRIGQSIRNQAKGEIGHTYNGLYFNDKWRMTSNFTLNYGLRWEFETWPSAAVNNPMKNFDPRAGFSWALGTKRNFVVRAGAGLFHGIIPSPLLMCQIPSCGGTTGRYPGRDNIEDTLNSTTQLFAFGAPAPLMVGEFAQAIQGIYPTPVPGTNFAPQDATIVRFAQNHKPPYGAQVSLGVEIQPFSDALLDVSYLHVRGIHLGSFWNVNQPNPNPVFNDTAHLVHDSKGDVGFKNLYCPAFPNSSCLPGVGFGIVPNFRNPQYGVYFEADSRWDSQFDGLLVNFQKHPTHHVGVGISYTYSKGIDNGPNPSFVLIPQDSANFREERAVSSDHVKHRFVPNATFTTPNSSNPAVRGWELSTIMTFESPHYFTKFAGSDVNGDVFGNNDRVGIEPRNTFKGDSYQTIDLRLSRTFGVTEKVHLQAMAEAFNLLNRVNVHFFNTAFGAADFCNEITSPSQMTAEGCPTNPAQRFLEGSPNPFYGAPRAIFNPRQIQLALRFTW